VSSIFLKKFFHLVHLHPQHIVATMATEQTGHVLKIFLSECGAYIYATYTTSSLCKSGSPDDVVCEL